MSSPKLPFFVYGTLRPGQYNYSALLGNEFVDTFTAAEVRGFIMISRGMYPMALRGYRDDDIIHGTVLSIRDAKYDEVVKKLDGLEGYYPDRAPSFNHYERIIVNVRYTDENLNPRSTPAYMYVCPEANEKQYMKCAAVPSGDWVAYRGQDRQVAYD